MSHSVDEEIAEVIALELVIGSSLGTLRYYLSKYHVHDYSNDASLRVHSLYTTIRPAMYGRIICLVSHLYV